MRVHPFELLGSSERKWGVAGVWKIYPVELQDRARLHFSLYLLSCGICATEDTGAAGPSTVDSKYLYLQHYGKYRKSTEGKNILCTYREIMHLRQVNKIGQ